MMIPITIAVPVLSLIGAIGVGLTIREFRIARRLHLSLITGRPL